MGRRVVSAAGFRVAFGLSLSLNYLLPMVKDHTKGGLPCQGFNLVNTVLLLLLHLATTPTTRQLKTRCTWHIDAPDSTRSLSYTGHYCITFAFQLTFHAPLRAQHPAGPDAE